MNLLCLVCFLISFISCSHPNKSKLKANSPNKISKIKTPAQPLKLSEVTTYSLLTRITEPERGKFFIDSCELDDKGNPNTLGIKKMTTLYGLTASNVFELRFVQPIKKNYEVCETEIPRIAWEYKTFYPVNPEDILYISNVKMSIKKNEKINWVPSTPNMDWIQRVDKIFEETFKSSKLGSKESCSWMQSNKLTYVECSSAEYATLWYENEVLAVSTSNGYGGGRINILMEVEMEGVSYYLLNVDAPGGGYKVLKSPLTRKHEFHVSECYLPYMC